MNNHSLFHLRLSSYLLDIPLEGMRRADQQQNRIFSYLSPEARVRNDHPLRGILPMVDEVLTLLKTRVNAIGHGLVPLPTLGLRGRRETGLFEL
jgi:hypothetical protein